MANKRELHITIDPKGKVSVNVKCVAGSACTTTSEFLERAMGGKVESRELTEDYYAANPGEGHCEKAGE